MTEQASSSLGITVLRDGLALGEVYDPVFPDYTADTADTSAQNNIGGVETKTVTWIRTGNLSFNLRNIGSATQDALWAAFHNRTSSVWGIVMPQAGNLSSHSYTWVGQISKMTPITDGTETAGFSVEVTVNGAITHTSTRAGGLTTPFFAVKDDGAATLTPSPPASATIYEYTIQAYSNSKSVTITPSAAAGTIYVNGVAVPSGTASDAIDLNLGTGAVTMIPIVVTELNKTPRVTWLRFVIGATERP